MTLFEKAVSLPNGELLRQILSGLLRSGAPKILLWGPRFHAFSNEAYADLDPLMDMNRNGETFATLLPDVWAQIRESLVQSFHGAERLSAQAFLNREVDGRVAPLHYTAYFTPLYGQAANAGGVLIDIQETTEDRPLSQRLLFEKQQMQQLFGELPVFMAYCRGEELRLQFVNTAFRKFYAFRPLEGLRVEEAIPEAAGQGFVTLLREVLRTGEPYVGNDIPMRLRSGSEEAMKYVDFIYQPVRNSQGRPIGVLCTGVDVTEQHKMKADSDRFKHRALHESRINAMGTMAMTLAHELNQPLAAAASYLSAARRSLKKSNNGDDHALDMLNLGIDQIKRAGNIIGRASPLLRTGEASRRDVSISDAVDHALSLLSAGRPFELEITKDIPPDADTVLADEIQLEQVLVNLFRNAAHAAKHARRKELVVSSRALPKNRVRICVRDFGRGLADEEIGRIFELGPRGHRTGLGIGLPLSRTLIEANGGVMSATNAEGGGAEFYLELNRPSGLAT
ncbi:MAG: PAS domain-containing protein [Porphyrobacter sp.]|nr:PAS domain-containing protein [Porphyrobacter sp.]